MTKGYYFKNNMGFDDIKWLESPENTNIEKGEEIIVSYHSEFTVMNGPTILFWGFFQSFGSLFITNRRVIFCAPKAEHHNFDFVLDRIGELEDEWDFGKNVDFEFKKGSFFALDGANSILINSIRLKMRNNAREVVTYLNGPFIEERKKSLEKKANELLDSQTDTDSLLGAATNYKLLGMKEKFGVCITKLALKCEKLQDFDGAIDYYKIINSEDDIIRLRKQKSNKVKVDQTVVHGDYVDDRDTIVKDSVISKSNVGAGGKSKAEELRETKALLDEGIIDDDEFKQMKKEILGK